MACEACFGVASNRRAGVRRRGLVHRDNQSENRILLFTVSNLGVACRNIRAIAYQHHLDRFGGKFSTAVVIAGLIMMSAAIVLFRETSRASSFPGTQSLLAVTGCMLVCLFQRKEAVVTRVLTTGLAQHFGRISYSWYLWHWPPLCFFFILESHSPDFVPALSLTLLGYGLAVASYTTFEAWGLRTQKLKSAHLAFAMLGAFLVLAGATGTVLLGEDGLLFRYPKGEQLLYAAQMDTVSYRCPLLRRLAAWRDEICQLNDTKKAGGVLIVGDLFADQAKTAIVSLGNENDVAVYMTKQNCQILDYFVHNIEKPYCAPSQWESIQKDIEKRVSPVLSQFRIGPLEPTLLNGHSSNFHVLNSKSSSSWPRRKALCLIRGRVSLSPMISRKRAATVWRTTKRFDKVKTIS